jgi:hypothetical protein
MFPSFRHHMFKRYLHRPVENGISPVAMPSRARAVGQV